MKKLTNFHKNLQTLELPNYEFSAKSRNTIGRAGACGKILDIFVLSCPDYESNGCEYTFGQLGSGIPLLTKLHLAGIEPILELCEEGGVKATVEVLIADVEAVNPALVNAYTGGNAELYQKKCDESVLATSKYVEELFCKFSSIDCTVSSFLRRFEPNQTASHDIGQNYFLQVRQQYKERLIQTMTNDSNLRFKLHNNVRAKANSSYYQSEYAGQLNKETARIDQELLTMAEYLALGQLIGSLASQAIQPILVTHNTANVHQFNATNRINIATGNVVAEVPAIPLVVYTKSVIAQRGEGKMV